MKRVNIYYLLTGLFALIGLVCLVLTVVFKDWAPAPGLLALIFLLDSAGLFLFNLRIRRQPDIFRTLAFCFALAGIDNSVIAAACLILKLGPVPSLINLALAAVFLVLSAAVLLVRRTSRRPERRRR